MNNLFFILFNYFSLVAISQNTHIQFTYDAAGNRTGRQIVIEPINETDSVVKDSNQAAPLISEVINMGDGLQGDGLQVTGNPVTGGQETSNPSPDNLLPAYPLPVTTLQFQIFPNPTYGRLNINLSGTLPEQALQLAVTNAGGSLLFTQDLLFSSNTINLSHLPAGVYYINVIAGGKKLKEYKVVKL